MEIVIPEYITVHLGAPDDRSAENIRVPFSEYLKNVASSEIYPTWPDSALRANIYAQATFALNRIFTEWYPSRGYDFDITSDTRYDQKFIRDREIYEPVSRLVDELYNNYVVRQGQVQPLYTQYCNGTTSTCSGLSQWGTVDLARQGLTPYEILQYYYGNDINIVFNAPTGARFASYPGIPLQLGSAGEDVRILKRQLNRIGQNFPGVQPYLPLTEFFDVQTEEAVRNFQEIFNLSPSGIVDKATWYKIKSIYNGVKGLAELETEGLQQSEVERQYARVLAPGDSGLQVQFLQYYLSVVAYFDPDLPLPSGNGVYDEATERAVREFQANRGLRVDGITGRETWNALVNAYDEAIASIPPQYRESADEIYPGRALAPGQTGRSVEVLQEFLQQAAGRTQGIPTVGVTGIYDDDTVAAITAVQALRGFEQNGVTGPLTWNAVVNLAKGNP